MNPRPAITRSLDAVEIRGVTYRQLDHWVRRGYLRPDQPAPGSGNAREWSGDELRVAQLMACLKGAGFAPAAAADYARQLLRLATFGPPVRLTIAHGIVLELDAATHQDEEGST